MRRVKEIFIGYLLPMIAVLTIDILVVARLASLMPMKYCGRSRQLLMAE